MSSASAADRVHCRAKRSRPGPISEKQLFQFSWLATFSMTFSRSLFSRRCQPMNLSKASGLFSVGTPSASTVGHAEEVDLEKVADSLIGGEKSHKLPDTSQTG